MSIQRVHPHDQILYQTERYHTQNFGYNIPIKEEGQYVIGNRRSCVHQCESTSGWFIDGKSMYWFNGLLLSRLNLLLLSYSPSVLKFSEVYFNAPGQKVFDVVLNNDHSIVSDLDIYSMVGHGVAHDEVIPFTISDGMLKVQVPSLCLSFECLSTVDSI